MSHLLRHSKTWINRAELHFALSCVTVRSIKWNLPKGPPWFKSDFCVAIPPIFDLFNHNAKSNVKFTIEKNGIIVKAISDVKKDRELLIDYGIG